MYNIFEKKFSKLNNPDSIGYNNVMKQMYKCIGMRQIVAEKYIYNKFCIER